MSDSDCIHKIAPKFCDPKDFWGQVKRTVNGEPVSEPQIIMITEAIQSGLGIKKSDQLLDIGCGNGALGARFFSEITSYVGVDFSPYLIQVARDNFSSPLSTFIESDAIRYLKSESMPTQFNKCLCYGVFSYFSHNDSEEFLDLVFRRFTNVTRLFIGNLPDRKKCKEFFARRDSKPLDLDDHTSAIGIWRTEEEFLALCSASGWHCEIRRMGPLFYAGSYRYDAILTRKT